MRLLDVPLTAEEVKDLYQNVRLRLPPVPTADYWVAGEGDPAAGEIRSPDNDYAPPRQPLDSPVNGSGSVGDARLIALRGRFMLGAGYHCEFEWSNYVEGKAGAVYSHIATSPSPGNVTCEMSQTALNGNEDIPVVIDDGSGGTTTSLCGEGFGDTLTCIVPEWTLGFRAGEIRSTHDSNRHDCRSTLDSNRIKAFIHVQTMGSLGLRPVFIFLCSVTNGTSPAASKLTVQGVFGSHVQ